MNLYIVDYRYKIDDIEEKDIWTLACKNEKEVHETMDRNFKEFLKYNITPIDYSFRRVYETSNGYKIKVLDQVKN